MKVYSSELINFMPFESKELRLHLCANHCKSETLDHLVETIDKPDYKNMLIINNNQREYSELTFYDEEIQLIVAKEKVNKINKRSNVIYFNCFNNKKIIFYEESNVEEKKKVRLFTILPNFKEINFNSVYDFQIYDHKDKLIIYTLHGNNDKIIHIYNEKLELQTTIKNYNIKCMCENILIFSKYNDSGTIYYDTNRNFSINTENSYFAWDPIQLKDNKLVAMELDYKNELMYMRKFNLIDEKDFIKKPNRELMKICH